MIKNKVVEVKCDCCDEKVYIYNHNDELDDCDDFESMMNIIEGFDEVELEDKLEELGWFVDLCPKCVKKYDNNGEEDDLDYIDDLDYEGVDYDENDDD